jgi:hypothetical protein
MQLGLDFANTRNVGPLIGGEAMWFAMDLKKG